MGRPAREKNTPAALDDFVPNFSPHLRLLKKMQAQTTPAINERTQIRMKSMAKRLLSKLLRLYKNFVFRSRIHMLPVQDPGRQEAARHAAIGLMQQMAQAKGVVLEYAGNGDPIIVTKGRQRFLVSPEHYLYAGDLCNQFDYYFSSTLPDEKDEMEIVDYSKPGWHTVRETGQRLYYTSLAEDFGATRDYMRYLMPREGEIVLDVGAYCGLSVLTFARAVGPSGKVIAFEPDPRNFEALKTNVAESGTQNVVIENKAMSGSAGQLLFSSEGNMGSAIVAKETERGKVIEVECTTLRDVVARYQLTKVGVVKLDIEGAEYGVIENSADVIRDIGARWAVELHYNPVTGLPVDVDKVRRVFDQLGYLTFLQRDSDTAAAPTLFAYPADKFRP
jgi:FkbM family methyltransferase